MTTTTRSRQARRDTTAKEKAKVGAGKVAAVLQCETDPSGLGAHEAGAKLDEGKLRPELVLGGFARALEAVTKVGTDGAAKYSDNGWKQVTKGLARYLDAGGRHKLARQKGEIYDPDSGSLHLAHEAWNALAALELSLQESQDISADGVTI